MSEYSFILRTVKENPGLTAAQIAALPGIAQQHDEGAIDQALAMLVKDNRITLTGSVGTGTYTSTVSQ